MTIFCNDCKGSELAGPCVPDGLSQTVCLAALLGAGVVAPDGGEGVVL